MKKRVKVESVWRRSKSTYRQRRAAEVGSGFHCSSSARQVPSNKHSIISEWSWIHQQFISSARPHQLQHNNQTIIIIFIEPSQLANRIYHSTLRRLPTTRIINPGASVTDLFKPFPRWFFLLIEIHITKFFSFFFIFSFVETRYWIWRWWGWWGWCR